MDTIEINGASEEVVGPIRDALRAAPKASPAFTGTPTAPTADPGTDTTQLATTAFTQAAIDALVTSALGGDPDFAATMAAALAGKLAVGGQWSAVVTESGTARLLAIGDAGAYIRLTNSSPCTITVPAQADVAWAANTEIQFRVAGTGIPAVVGGSGVTIHNAAAAASLAQHGTFALKRVAENTWDFI